MCSGSASFVYSLIISLFFKFIYFERESAHKKGRGRERRGRQRIPSRLRAQHGVDSGIHLTDHEIVT